MNPKSLEILDYPVDPQTVRQWCVQNNISVAASLETLDLTAWGWYPVAYVPPPSLITPGNTVVLDTPRWQEGVLVRTFKEVPREPQVTQKLWDSVRERRNQLLEESDWTELPSVTGQKSDQWIQAWKQYRSQLRNITSQSADPEMVEWPTPPEE